MNERYPILVTDNVDYDKPTVIDNDGGVFAVKQKSVPKLQNNKYYFYEPGTDSYYDITPDSVSPDFYTRIQETEQQMRKEASKISNSENSTQVNSLADVIIKTGTEALEGEGLVKNLVKNTGSMLYQTFIAPFKMKDAGPLAKVFGVVNNAFVNIGETVDLVTGASMIKGLILGKESSDESLRSIYYWDKEKGRAQYDWNTDLTNNGVVDFFINMGLEILSDPTTYVSFGAKRLLQGSAEGAIGRVLKSTLPDALLKSTDTDTLARKLSKKLVTTKDIDEALQHVNLTKLIYKNTDEAIDVYSAMKLSSNIRKELANTLLEDSTYHMLQSTLKTVDAIQTVPFKTAMYSSALGVGFGLTKETLKLGAKAAPYLNSKLVKLLNIKQKENITYKNYDVVMDIIKRDLTTYKDIVGVESGEVIDDAIKNVTDKMQREVVEEIRTKVLSRYRKIDNATDLKNMYEELDKFAVRQGFKHADDMVASLRQFPDRISEAAKSTINLIVDLVDTKNANVLAKEINPLRLALSDINLPKQLTLPQQKDAVTRISSLLDTARQLKVLTPYYTMHIRIVKSKIQYDLVAKKLRALQYTAGKLAEVFEKSGTISRGKKLNPTLTQNIADVLEDINIQFNAHVNDLEDLGLDNIKGAIPNDLITGFKTDLTGVMSNGLNNFFSFYDEAIKNGYDEAKKLARVNPKGAAQYFRHYEAEFDKYFNKLKEYTDVADKEAEKYTKYLLRALDKRLDTFKVKSLDASPIVIDYEQGYCSKVIDGNNEGIIRTAVKKAARKSEETAVKEVVTSTNNNMDKSLTRTAYDLMSRGVTSVGTYDEFKEMVHRKLLEILNGGVVATIHDKKIKVRKTALCKEAIKFAKENNVNYYNALQSILPRLALLANTPTLVDTYRNIKELLNKGFQSSDVATLQDNIKSAMHNIQEFIDVMKKETPNETTKNLEHLLSTIEPLPDDLVDKYSKEYNKYVDKLTRASNKLATSEDVTPEMLEATTETGDYIAHTQVPEIVERWMNTDEISRDELLYVAHVFENTLWETDEVSRSHTQTLLDTPKSSSEVYTGTNDDTMSDVIETMRTMAQSLDYVALKNVQFTPEQLAADIKAVKASQVYALDLILSDENTTNTLNEILSNNGLGELLSVMINMPDTELGRAGLAIKATASSVYAYASLHKRLGQYGEDIISKECLNGLYDALASFLRKDLSDYDADYFSDLLIKKTEEYINKRNNVYSYGNCYIKNNVKTIPVADSSDIAELSQYTKSSPTNAEVYKQKYVNKELTSMLFTEGAVPAEDAFEICSYLNKNTSKDTMNDVQKILDDVLEADAKNEDVVYVNVPFSIGQYGTDANSGVFEMCLGDFKDPEKVLQFRDKTQDNLRLKLRRDPTYTGDVLKMNSKNPEEVIKTIQGYERDLEERIKAEPNIKLSKIEAESSDDFVNSIDSYFEDMKTYADEMEKKTGKRYIIRLVGFNTSETYSNGIQVFNGFTRRNRINIRAKDKSTGRNIIEHIDLKKTLMARTRNVFFVTDDAAEVIRKEMRVFKQYLDSWNSSAELLGEYDNIHASLPNITAELLDTIKDSANMITEALYRKADENLKLINEKDYGTLMAFPAEVLKDSVHKLTLLHNSLADSLNTIRRFNEELGTDLITIDKLYKNVGTSNIMHFLDRWLRVGDGALAVSCKTIHDANTYRAWFKQIKATNGYELAVKNKLVKKLQDIVERITHPEILDGIFQDEYVPDVLRRLAKDMIYLANSEPVSLDCRRYMKMFYELNLADPRHIYAYCVKLLDYLRHGKSPAHKKFFEKANDEYGELWWLVLDGRKTLLKNNPLYTAESPIYRSSYLKPDNALREFADMAHSIETYYNNINVMKDAIKTKNDALEAIGVTTINDKVKLTLLQLYDNFVTSVVDTVNSIKLNYYEELKSGDTIKAYDARIQYTKSINSVMLSEKNAAKLHALDRALQITSMDAKTYVDYLYRYCQGVQVFDMNSSVFKDKVVSNNFIELCNKLRSEDGITIKQKDKFVYITLSDDRARQIFSTRKAMKEQDSSTSFRMHFESGKGLMEYYPDAMQEPNNIFVQNMALLDYIDGSYGNAYAISLQRAMNGDRYRELREFLPDEIKANVVGQDFLYEHGMVDGFMHNVVGDYESPSKVFSKYSNSLITNLASGVNNVFNRLNGREYVSELFFNQYNNFEIRVKNSTIDGIPITPKEIREALESTNSAVCSIKDGKLKIFDIKTEDDVNEAFKTHAAIIDYGSLDTLRTMYEDNNIISSNKVIAAVQHGLVLQKVGYLCYSIGWALRNALDSNIKGMLASDSAVNYFTAMRETKQRTSLYTKIDADIRSTFKNASPNTILKYFKEKPTELSQQMSYEEFKLWDYFYSTTVSAPTAAQISMMNDTVGKLFRRVEGTQLFVKEDINNFLNIYTEYKGNYFQIKRKLLSMYSEKQTDILLTLYSNVPKNYMTKQSTTKMDNIMKAFYDKSPVVKLSNMIEADARAHAFYYNAVHNGYDLGEATKLVEKSQFNRAHDSRAKKVFEMLMPFSSFQIDNVLFWMDVLTKSRGSVYSVVNDYMESRYDEEEMSPDDMIKSTALQSMFLSGNLILGENSGSTLKISDSFSSSLKFLADPIGGTLEMLNTPTENAIKLFKAIGKEYMGIGAENYYDVKPISEWTRDDYTEDILDLIPFFGAVALRYKYAWEKPVKMTGFLSYVMPSIFGSVPTDEAGTSYESRPIGFDWYNQTPEYKSTHRFVYGLSYVPSYLTSNPQTYANTLQRLINMGYSEELAKNMVYHWGYYMKAPDYILRQYNNTGTATATTTKEKAPRKARVQRPRRTYARKSYKKYGAFTNDTQYRMRRGQPQKIYRTRLYSSLYSRNGVPRSTMYRYRGNSTCSIKLQREVVRGGSMNRRFKAKRLFRL